jgi:hypothetical protein
MVEPWRLYSIFEIGRPNRRRGACQNGISVKLGPVCAQRQERKVRLPYHAARKSTAELRTAHFRPGSEFDLRKIADFRYGLGRLAADAASANAFR